MFYKKNEEIYEKNCVISLLYEKNCVYLQCNQKGNVPQVVASVAPVKGAGRNNPKIT